MRVRAASENLRQLLKEGAAECVSPVRQGDPEPRARFAAVERGERRTGGRKRIVAGRDGVHRARAMLTPSRVKLHHRGGEVRAADGSPSGKVVDAAGLL